MISKSHTPTHHLWCCHMVYYHYYLSCYQSRCPDPCLHVSYTSTSLHIVNVVLTLTLYIADILNNNKKSVSYFLFLFFLIKKNCILILNIALFVLAHVTKKTWNLKCTVSVLYMCYINIGRVGYYPLSSHTVAYPCMRDRPSR